MKLEIINSKEAPKAIGPYCHGIKQGNILLTSGQLPLDPTTNEMVTEIKAATRRVLDNLLSIVVAAGGSLETIAKVDIFVTNLDDFAAINEVYTDFFKGHTPARALVEVVRLPAGAPLEAATVAFVAE